MLKNKIGFLVFWIFLALLGSLIFMSCGTSTLIIFGEIFIERTKILYLIFIIVQCLLCSHASTYFKTSLIRLDAAPDAI